MRFAVNESRIEAGREHITDDAGNQVRKAVCPKSPLPILTAGYVPIGFRLIKRNHLIRCKRVDRSASKAGVYFLFKDRELVYVGSSGNVWSRLGSHKKLKKIEFDIATYMPIAFPWYLSVEAAYIAHYMPTSNVRHAPTCISRDNLLEYRDRGDSLDEVMAREPTG